MDDKKNDCCGFGSIPKLIVCIVLCCFACLPLSRGKAAAESIDNVYFKIAADMLNKGLYLESIGVYQDIIGLTENAENRAKAHLYIGTTYSLYLDREESSLKQLDTVLKNYPLTVAASDALFNKGMVLYKTGRFDDASGMFQQYVERYPNSHRRGSAEIWAESATQSAREAKPGREPAVELDIADSTIRVLLKEKAKTLTVKAEQGLAVYGSFAEQPIAFGNGPYVFTQAGKSVFLNGRRVSCRPCRLVPDGKTTTLDGHRYRGFLTVSKESNGLEAVNHNSVEGYLYGVVPKEMPSGWPKEALKAQAVAARTYALYVKGKRRDKSYDVDATTASQVYGGYDAETLPSNAAVNETKGQVITYDGKLVVAYFHASSGGHTEDARNVWSADIPYLSGIPDRYSANVPEGNWECFLSYDLVRDRLNQYGFSIGRIDRLTTVNTPDSGRAAKVTFHSDRGNLTLSSNDFRIKLGSKRLKSTLFKIDPNNEGIFFRGKGFGHGVGMSQWGAKRMAEQGYTYKEILNFYYKNVRIITAGLY
jgi:stage II sporulation protein D (peptidoglycan lytic transglycosylase)